MRAWSVVDLGTEPFRDTWARQLALVEARQKDAAPDTLLLVEHPHVFTLGRKREALANVLVPGDVEVIGVERGGDVTYHGPGQIVAYPIVRLEDGERDLHRYLRNLEEAVIATCARFGLATDREPGKTGVWMTTRSGMRKKLCSMGIACRRWVTFHGLALNVTADLTYFQRINPCGFEASVMTSMAEQLDDAVDRRSRIAGGGVPDGFASGAGVLPRGIDRRSRIAGSGGPDDFASGAGVLPRGIDLAQVRRVLAGELGHALQRAPLIADQVQNADGT